MTESVRDTGSHVLAPLRAWPPARRSEAGRDPVTDRGHEHLVRSLADLLGVAPDAIEDLLDELRGDLLGEPGREAAAPPDDDVAEAFERGLQLGLLVGLGSDPAARVEGLGAEASEVIGR